MFIGKGMEEGRGRRKERKGKWNNVKEKGRDREVKGHKGKGRKWILGREGF